MTDALVETLRLRGPGAARLARVAATALPGSLDRALAGLPAARIESLSVRLDLDPSEYDDVTLATLWADAIVAELLRLLPEEASEQSRADAVTGFAGPSRTGSLTLAHAVAAARAWLAPGDRDRWVPTDALAIADLVSRAPLATHDEDLGELLLALAAALTSPPHPVGTSMSLPGTTGTSAPAAHSDGEPEAPAANPAPRATQPPAARPTRGEAGARAAGSVGQPEVAAVSAATARIAALAALAEPGTPFVDLETVTAAAGIALLYPWLADLCRDAVALHPGLDESAVRAHALAAILDPDDPSLLADPLITFLAGVMEPLPLQMHLPQAPQLRDNAERVLASFASLLPGFGESSAEFVRSEWIRRTGLLDADLDPARLTAATHPLDVLLGRLPYPLALFKLPWSPALTVRFRP